MLCSLAVLMEHCDNCSQHYSSSINYKRHIGLHKRDSEQISSEEEKEVASFKGVVLKEVVGSSSIKELTTIVPKAVFVYLPQPYLKSGSQILDIIEDGRLPLSSEQLFTVLNCTSKKAFLCGPTSSLQELILDGKERMVLESKNFIAYTGIHLELKLGSQASTPTFDSQSPKLTMSIVNSHQEAQDSQGPKFTGFPTHSRVLQGLRGPNLSRARPHLPQQFSQAPELANRRTFSHHLAPRPFHAAYGPRAANARSCVPQIRSGAAQKPRPSRHRRNPGDHRSASSPSQDMLTSKGEPELARGFSEARGQKDSTPVKEDEKAADEVSLSSTSERVSWSDMVEDEPWEEPEAPTKEQESTNEQAQAKKHRFVISSSLASINPEFESLPVSFGTFKPKDHDNSEARGTTPMAEGQTPELSSSHDEPEEPDPGQSGPIVELWTETPVPNRDRRF